MMLTFTSAVHCKNIRISTDILWRIFHILMEPVLYTFVSANRRNCEAWAHSAQNIRWYTDIFTVYATCSCISRLFS